MLIDISNWQGSIDWSRADQVIEGAYIKITEGTGYVDPRWQYNHDECTRYNRPAGAYHFADLGDPIAEANHFADVYLSRAWQLRPVLDIETNGATSNWVMAFRAQFRARVGSPGFRVYTGLWLAQGPLNPDNWVDPNSDVWVAAYRSVLGWDHPSLVLWQNTDAGQVPGILGNVDEDQYMHGWTPARDTGPAPVEGHDNMGYQVQVPAGEDAHFILPCTGTPQFWYLGTSYGRKVAVHQIDYVMPTDFKDGQFAPGGFNDGSLDANGFQGANDKTWWFDADRPGPVPIPNLNGNQPVCVSVRYSADDEFTAWTG